MGSISAVEPVAGSSPLARGLHAHVFLFTGINGIIPARAGFTTRRRTSFRRITDHPRSRGVYPSLLSQYCFARGSSPLARGLRQHFRRRPRRCRIIPARAGFTVIKSWSCSAPKDHPRSRGVYGRMTTAQARVAGSSPLARGLLLIRNALAGMAGIIPARAGFTCAYSRTWRWRGDHPRSRGVYRGY